MTPVPENIDWNKNNGLVPAIIQDDQSLRVLMLGYMSPEALRQTIETKTITFYSRTRQRLWQKGEASGNTLTLRNLSVDCDNDTLLVKATPNGPTCHRGTTTCWDTPDQPALADLSTLADLQRTIRARKTAANPDTSYTARLFAEGLPRIAQKVGEEGVEVALAGATSAPNLAEEAADLLYHLLVLLEARNTPLADVLSILRTRGIPVPSE